MGQRYQQRGVEALFDAPRSGRPQVFSLPAPGHDRAHRRHGPQRLRVAPAPVGLPQLAAGGGGAGRRARYPLPPQSSPSGAGQVAPPHRSRYWKTARLAEEVVGLAAKVRGCYEHVDWL